MPLNSNQITEANSDWTHWQDQVSSALRDPLKPLMFDYGKPAIFAFFVICKGIPDQDYYDDFTLLAQASSLLSTTKIPQHDLIVVKTLLDQFCSEFTAFDGRQTLLLSTITYSWTMVFLQTKTLSVSIFIISHTLLNMSIYTVHYLKTHCFLLKAKTGSCDHEYFPKV